VTVLLVAIGIIALAGTGRWYLARRRGIPSFARRLARTPERRIAAHAGGPTRFVGSVVVTGAQLEAPLSARPCVYYRVVVEELDDTRGDHGWVVLLDTRDHAPFWLHDDSGRARVDLTHSRVDVALDVDLPDHDLVALTRGATMLARHGLTPGPRRILRFREGILGAGQTIAVAGRAARTPDPEPPRDARDYREGPELVLELSGTPREPVLVSFRAGVAATSPPTPA
jgi:hypothetical protein